MPCPSPPSTVSPRISSNTLTTSRCIPTALLLNMLLLGGSSPMKVLIGAITQGNGSLNTGFDPIVASRTMVGIVGGVDKLYKDESFASTDI